jgi:hypothetical protein
MRLATRFRRWGDRQCRGGVVLLSVLGYLAAVVGYPLPARPSHSSDKPFPCQHHACGCVDAQQCWRGCCCYTPAEKLAWARANHVTPPAYAEQATDNPQLARHDHENDHGHPASAGHAARCDHATAGHDTAGRSPHRCCAPRAPHAGRCAAVEESPAAGTCRAPAATDSAQDPGPVQFVSSDAWRKCRGLPTLWVASGAAVTPPTAIRWQFSWDVIEWLSTSPPALYDGCLVPPVPPPRV